MSEAATAYRIIVLQRPWLESLGCIASRFLTRPRSTVETLCWTLLNEIGPTIESSCQESFMHGRVKTIRNELPPTDLDTFASPSRIMNGHANMISKDWRANFRTIESFEVARSFSRYPAGVSIAEDAVVDALTQTYITASTEGSRERRRAQIRHSNPHGNAFAICHCSAYPDRLVLLASLVEVMWIHDDITEELDHESACTEHDILAEVLTLDANPDNIVAKNPRQLVLARILRNAIDIDPGQAPTMIQVLKTYLSSFDSLDEDFDRMKDYMPYRIANCGYWISSFFIRWGLDLVMQDDDYESIRDYDVAMGNILGLANDYFSWNVEKDQPTDRIRNGVRVLMREHGVSAEAARSLLLGVIVEEESKAAELKRLRLKQSVSEEVSRYFEAIELYVGGSCYWHATAPRYWAR